MAIKNGLKFNIFDGKVVLESIEDETIIKVDIPMEVDGYPVVMIDEQAFWNCYEIEEINIPDSVDTIQDEAINGCFGLKRITLGKKVDFIGTGNFALCDSLEEINVVDGSERYMSKEGVLYSKNNIWLLKYPGGKSNTEFVVEKEVSVIQDEAFSDSRNLIKIIIENDDCEIGIGAFYACKSLETVKLPGNLKIIPSNAFFNCMSLKEISIPKSVELIEEGAFEACTSLKKINYNGSSEDWNKINFKRNWNSYIKKIKVVCTDKVLEIVNK